MKEAYILAKSRFRDHTMNVNNYQESLNKIVKILNQSKEDYINLYITFDDLDYHQRKALFKAICRYLTEHSINRINLHLVIDGDFVYHQEDIITFVYYMIEKYRKIDQLDIILDMIIDGQDIKDDQIKLAKLISKISPRFLKIWVHIQEDNIKDISEIMYKLTFNNLLSSSLITLDIDLNDEYSCGLKQTIYNIPREALVYLVESYLDETSDWLTRFDKSCFDSDGSLLKTCPNSSSCILVRKNHSKLQMIPLLKEIVYSLQGTNISSEGGFGIRCNECDNTSCPCHQ